jgi:hypothetical protein
LRLPETLTRWPTAIMRKGKYSNRGSGFGAEPILLISNGRKEVDIEHRRYQCRQLESDPAQALKGDMK